MEPYKLAERYYMEQDKRLENTLCRDCQYCLNTGLVKINGKYYEVGYCEYGEAFLSEKDLNQTMKEGGCV